MKLPGADALLVVEDDEYVRALTSRILREQGYTVLEAVDGVHALELIGEDVGNTISLMVTDVMMPRLDGKLLAEKLKSVRPDIKTIFTSGCSSEALGKLGIPATPNSFLSKPFDPKALTRMVREVLDASLDRS